MEWKSPVRIAIALGLGGALVGCATFGEDDYGCGGLPEGVSCKSAREVYEMRTGHDAEMADEMWREWVADQTGTPPAGIPPRPDPDAKRKASKTEVDPVLEDDDDSTALSYRVVNSTDDTAGKKARTTDTVVEVPPMPRVESPAGRWRSPALPEGSVPVRSPARVMRIWVAAWEDTRGDLIVPGYLYTEIEPRRWEIGLPSTRTAARRVFTPTAVRSDTDAALPAATSVVHGR